MHRYYTKKNKLRCLYLVLVVAMFISVTFCPPVRAAAAGLDCSEHVEDTCSTRSITGSCGVCSGGVTHTYCYNSFSYYETGTHWTLSGTCTVNYYMNMTYEYCENCHNIEFYDGRHDCLQVHTICYESRNHEYDTCPCIYKWID